ncbi:MAG TPA: hypothetical protein DHV36_22605, partial [Desulfobacteraceae bacterium]|nr:hypothetical protein [Desulfobacteraceae bacterium]
MAAPRNLQAKLLVSVCIIVSVTVSVLSILVFYMEKKRVQAHELERIFYKADAMKKRLGHLMYGKNWRYLMMTLSNAKTADPSLLFFAVTDPEGRVLAADDETLVGKAFERTQPLAPANPLVRKPASPDGDAGMGAFSIFLSRFFPTGPPAAVHKGEVVFEVIYDIVYLNQPMGTLRAGYSRADMNRHLKVLLLSMLGTGVLILLAIILMIYLVIRRHMVPIESFVAQLSGLDFSREGRSVRDSLSAFPLDENPKETQDVRQLKQAFRHIRDQFVRSWDQLENHRTNLSQIVDERTAALNASNEQLSRQIKERKEIESRLLTVQKLEAIGTLAGGVAHEFNNLFMAITGYATLIQKRSEPGHPNIEMAEKIRRLVENGSRSVQQLLGFARSGKYSPGPLNLNEILRGSLVILASSRKKMSVEADYATDLWMVYADRSQMEQVVMNLLLNAADAIEGQGNIRVKTRNHELKEFQVSLEKTVSGKFICFSVVDDGPGIPPEIQPRIFDPFFTT